MKAIHQGLPLREFHRPETGIVEVQVDADTGLLPSEYSTDTITEVFIAGTEPRVVETYHENREYRNAYYSDKMLTTISYESYDADLDLTIDDPFSNNDFVLEGLDIDLDFLGDSNGEEEDSSENSLLD